MSEIQWQWRERVAEERASRGRGESPQDESLADGECKCSFKLVLSRKKRRGEAAQPDLRYR